MRRILAPLWIIAVIGCVVYGIYVKSTFTDKLISTGENKFDVYQNTYYIEYEYIPEEEIDTEVERSFALSDLIAKVKYTGTSVYATGQIIFKCDVIEVYKGDTSLVGKQISYVAEDMNITAKYEMSSGSYVNHMKKDNEYLIFGTQLAGLLNGLPENLYLSSGPWFITYFSFSEHNNELITLEPLTAKGYEEYFGFMAKEYPDNEFFVTTDEALKNVLELKERFFERLESGEY